MYIEAETPQTCPFCLVRKRSNKRRPDQKLTCAACGRKFLGLHSLDKDFLPLIGSLAIHYGTLSHDQLNEAMRLHKDFERTGKAITLEAFLVDKKMASKKQMGLLMLIRDFLQLREQSESFGRIAIQRRLVEPSEIEQALHKQEEEFRQKKKNLLIGDILVEAGVLDRSQCEKILIEVVSEQKEIRVNQALMNEEERAVPLTPFEIRFLTIRELDKKFGEAVIRKGFVSHDALKNALNRQEKMFTAHRVIQQIDEILLRQGVVNLDQCRKVYEELKWPEDRLDALAYQMERKQEKEGEIDYFFDRGFPLKYIDRYKKKRVGEIGESFAPRGKILAKWTKRSIELTKKSDSLEIFLIKGRMDGLENVFFRCGKGVRVSSDGLKLIAKNEGVPRLSIEGKIHVFSKMNILGDADERAGSLGVNSHIYVKGIIKGAYSVKGGDVTAQEIRDADIEAIGDVKTAIGVYHSKIVAQGGVVATFIMNSEIDAYGDVVVENEIIDSIIRTSGACIVKKSRIIASRVYARKGVFSASIGSPVTEPCHLVVGTDAHIQMMLEKIDREINRRKEELETREKKLSEMAMKEKKIVKRMLVLKRDIEAIQVLKTMIAADQRDVIAREEERSSAGGGLGSVENINGKLTKLMIHLKKMDQGRRFLYLEKEALALELKKLKHIFQIDINEFTLDREAILQWAGLEKGIPVVKIRGRVVPETTISGMWGRVVLDKEHRNISIVEQKQTEKTNEAFVLSQLSD